MSDAMLAAVATVVAALVGAVATVWVANTNRRLSDGPVTRVRPEPRPTRQGTTRTLPGADPFMSDDYVARLVAEIRMNEQTGDDCTVDDGYRR